MLPKDETVETNTETNWALIAELQARGLVHNMTTKFASQSLFSTDFGQGKKSRERVGD